jgi:hypothetical protein
MALFFRRFIGTLVLDASAFEDIEADRHAGMQSVLVVLAVCLAGGMAATGLGLTGPAGFVTGAVMVLGAWLVWVAIINTVGTVVLSEPQTRTNVRELLRVLGFAAAPGVFLALAVLRPAAPLVFAVVAVWMIAAAVLGVRQALDYRSTTRAAAVCAIGWLLSFGIIAGFALLLSRPVS